MNAGGAEGGQNAWHKRAFEAPALRGLDAQSRTELAAASHLRSFERGDVVYREGERGDVFFVVISGKVSLTAVRRGDEHESQVRVARRGDTFGEEATLPGGVRRANATALEACELAELPMVVYRRVAARSGADGIAERELRALRRIGRRDLLKTLAFARDLPDDDLELLLDAVEEVSTARSRPVFTAGDLADACFLVVEGIVQLQTEELDRVQVRAYLTRGDLFGEDDVLAAERRRMSAVALGDCRCLRIPAGLMRTLVDRNPHILPRIRRVKADRHELLERIAQAGGGASTQHVFKDLYRMQMARSLLVIDPESCVRCGHCAWSCADLYGVSRLVRRGDKIVAQLTTDAPNSQAPRSLFLPNSCQHCRNPACMIDCPTGAIGRDPEGDVFIREDLCTGCGACAKACPWDNIQMAPRAAQTAQTSALVAVKCDLCRDYEGPACVQGCPTESIFRLDPAQQFGEVRDLLGGPAAARSAPVQHRPRRLLVPLALLATAALVPLALRLHALGLMEPGRGAGLVAGWLAGLACFALAAHVLPKRITRPWIKKRERASAARRAASAGAREGGPALVRSRVRVFVVVHTALGLLAIGGVLLHSGLRFSATIAGALAICFSLVAALGAFGAAIYRWAPPRLARLERRGALPEDLAAEREQLIDRLHRDLSGKDLLVKRIVERVLLPYAHSPAGPLLLIASGTPLADEERRLRARVDRLLEGRGGDRLAGLDDLVRTVVELRALPARRLLGAALRFWLPLHAALTVSLLVLLALHVVSMVRP
jgi:CRP-like cAMP-binding protein/Fe-S-cluster-containing dehydrogenase component